MGWAYSGDAGIVAGLSWAYAVNYQRGLPWFRKPWLHLTGAVAGYYIFKTAAAWEDRALQTVIEQHERKGYVIPEDRRKLFEPKEYK